MIIVSLNYYDNDQNVQYISYAQCSCFINCSGKVKMSEIAIIAKEMTMADN